MAMAAPAAPPSRPTRRWSTSCRSSGGPFEAPFPTEEPQPITCYSIASPTGETTLYEKPGGKTRIKLSPRTEWGSPRILGVVRRRGDWISVQAPELGNGEVAWMEANRASLDCVRWSMHVDLSRRRLSVERDGTTVRRFEIAVGRKGNPTPKGRFSVTDKLRVTDPGSPYGCCVLALTGHQTRLPASWPGGDRLAIHATRELSSLGRAASLGCMRVTSSQAKLADQDDPAGRAAVRPDLISRTARPARSMSVNLPPFQVLLEEHRADVYRFLVATAGPSDADDVFQETWIAALRAYPKLRSGDNLRAWLFRIAQNKSIDAHRARGRRAVPVAAVPERASGGGIAIGGDPEIWSRLRELPAKQRTAVFCRAVLGMPYEELAVLLESSEDAARRNVHEGLKRLREELKNDD